MKFAVMAFATCLGGGIALLFGVTFTDWRYWLFVLPICMVVGLVVGMAGGRIHDDVA
jgi:hypothetical protein